MTAWRILTPGGAAAVVTWMLVSAGFEIYVNSIATYDSTYGALGTTIAGLIWLWLTNLSVLVGAAVDREVERAREVAGGVPEEETLVLPHRDAPAEE